MPPEGVPPLNVIEVELIHTLLNVAKLTTGRAFTKMPEVSDDEQPLAPVYEYVITLLPVPAVFGLNIPPLTPVPL